MTQLSYVNRNYLPYLPWPSVQLAIRSLWTYSWTFVYFSLHLLPPLSLFLHFLIKLTAAVYQILTISSRFLSITFDFKKFQLMIMIRLHITQKIKYQCKIKYSDIPTKRLWTTSFFWNQNYIHPDYLSTFLWRHY